MEEFEFRKERSVRQSSRRSQACLCELLSGRDGSLASPPPYLPLVFFFLEEMKLERIFKSSLNGERSYIRLAFGCKRGRKNDYPLRSRMEP